MKERSAAGWVRVLFLELKRCLIEHLMLIEEEVYVGATRKYRRFEKNLIKFRGYWILSSASTYFLNFAISSASRAGNSSNLVVFSKAASARLPSSL